MPKTKRYPPKRPTQILVNFTTSSQTGSHESSCSEPVAHIAQSTHCEVQTNSSIQLDAQNPSSNQPEGQNLSQTQHEAQTPLRTYKRKSNKYWTVDVIDEEAVVKETSLRVQNVFVLPMGKKVVLEWNNDNQPIGDAAGLLGGFLGSIASNFENFSIGFEKWPKVPNTYKEHVWANTIKPKFQGNDEMNENYVLGNIGKKWRDNWIKLFDENYDPLLGEDANIDLLPDGISKDQWALFVNYSLNEKTMEICRKNRQKTKCSSYSWVEVNS